MNNLKQELIMKHILYLKKDYFEKNNKEPEFIVISNDLIDKIERLNYLNTRQLTKEEILCKIYGMDIIPTIIENTIFLGCNEYPTGDDL